MYTENELSSFNNEFCKIGLTDRKEQEHVLEFLYSLGTIMYNIKENNNTFITIKNG